MMGLRRRHGDDEGEKGLRESLLDTDDYTYSSDETSASAVPVHDLPGPSDNKGPIHELLKAIGQGLTVCASQLCTYIAWLLAGVNRRALTLEQIEELERLKSMLEAKYDHDDPTHQEALAELWSICFPDDGPVVYKSEHWKDAGFQGTDPATDFRGGGLYALNNLLYMARQHADTFQRLLHKKTGNRAEMEYPFCVAGINITFDLQELIGLRHRGKLTEGEPTSVEGRAFAVLIAQNPDAFEELYVCTFELLDRLWLDTGASYFEFQHVIHSTLDSVKKTLSLKPRDIQEVRALMLSS